MKKTLLVLIISLMYTSILYSAQIYIKGEYVNFRDAPNGNKIGVLNSGIKLDVLEQKGDWVKVRVEGWVYKPLTSNSNSGINKPKSISKSEPDIKWYKGGTLHKVNAISWQNASYDNKLATCADFIAKLWEDGKLKYHINNKINTIDDIYPFAIELVACLNEFTKKVENSQENRKLYENQKVSEMAVLCMLSMDWLK
ncbi:SH3 domain-containing protein [bacterium]|nr:MAG: SH3 domain-containing protein [bacterium]